MHISFKRKGVVAWGLGAALVGIAGCGGGGGTTTPPITSGIPVPAPVAGQSELLFSATRAAENASRRSGIFFTDLNGGKVFNVPITLPRGAQEATWLPSRRELLYVGFPPTVSSGRNAATSETPPGIRRVGRDGTNDREIPNSRGASGLSVSPDGRRIAYGYTRIVVCDVDGSNSRVLRTGGAPAWSPDGKRLVFSSFSAEENSPPDGDIYTMNADGSDVKRLTTSTEYESDPNWSPDGKRIVFQAGVETGFQTEIFVMNADGSNPARLTRNEAFDNRPKWTPDGSRIVFLSNSQRDTTAAGTLQVMNADGSNQVQLSADQLNNFDLR